MVLWIILIGVLIYLFATRFGRDSNTSRRADEDPLAILERRFAEGSLSEEEFVRMRKELLKRG